MNKLLTNFPVTLTEEQKNVLKLTLSAVLQDDPITKYWRPTVYENGDIMWALVASESEPLSQNIKGPSGFTPQFQIDQGTAEWQVTYDGTNWTPLGIIASGAQGPQGNPGQNGTNGTSVYLDDVSTVAGGTQVTLGWGTSDTSAFVIPSGAAGTPGTNGVSPTVELTPIQDQQYPQGGWNVTITDAEHQSGQTFQIFNGIDGQGATVDLVEGNGIQITHQAGTTDYTISVSADYALKSELPDVTDMATKTWVGQQGYLTSIPNTYALKSDVEAASANALSEAESWVENKHYLTSVPDSYATKTYANDASAYALSQAESWVETEGYLKAVPAEYATKTYANEASAYALSEAKTWVEDQRYLPTSGGTVSGQIVVSAARNTFDDNYIKCINDGNTGYARFGVGSWGGAVIKAVDGNNNPVQVNVRYNANNNELIQVQKSNADVGYLIPAQIHQGSYTPTTADGILHIVLES